MLPCVTGCHYSETGHEQQPQTDITIDFLTAIWLPSYLVTYVDYNHSLTSQSSRVGFMSRLQTLW